MYDLATVYADELTYISALFNQEGVNYNTDNLLTNIDLAWRAIAAYQWIDFDADDIQEKKFGYEMIISKLAIAYFNNAAIVKSSLKGENAVVQQTQGGRSITYRSGNVALDNWGLTPEVKGALPPRMLRVI